MVRNYKKIGYNKKSLENLDKEAGGNRSIYGNPSPICPAPNIEAVKKSRTKHGFYVKGYVTCECCPYYKDGKVCKKYCENETEEGNHFCSFEIEMFNDFKEKVINDFDLKDTDLDVLDEMIFKRISLHRGRAYLATAGMVMKSPTCNPKTGEVYWLDAPNPLLSKIDYASKDVREWLENLKISRKSREPTKNHMDIAIMFTEKKVLEHIETQKIQIEKKEVKEIENFS